MGTYTLNQAAGLPPPEDEVLGLPDREQLLDRAISYKTAQGSNLEHRMTCEAVMTSGRKVNHILHLLLTVFTLGLWLIVWLIMGLAGGENRYTLRVDEHGRVTEDH